MWRLLTWRSRRRRGERFRGLTCIHRDGQREQDWPPLAQFLPRACPPQPDYQPGRAGQAEQAKHQVRRGNVVAVRQQSHKESRKRLANPREIAVFGVHSVVHCIAAIRRRAIARIIESYRAEPARTRPLSANVSHLTDWLEGVPVAERWRRRTPEDEGLAATAAASPAEAARSGGCRDRTGCTCHAVRGVSGNSGTVSGAGGPEDAGRRSQIYLAGVRRPGTGNRRGPG